MIPALAVARELKARYGAEVLFVGTARGMENRLVPQAGFPLELVKVGALKNVSLFDKIQEVRQKGITMMIVEQNVVSGLSIADRGYVVQHGAVLLEDTAKNLLTNETVRAAYLGL